jgi:hypothetical protein
LKKEDGLLIRYAPKEVPDHLFTRNELSKMGLVQTGEHEAFVYYPDQKREFKLFNIEETRIPKKQSGFSLVMTDRTLEETLQRCKRR